MIAERPPSAQRLKVRAEAWLSGAALDAA